MNKTPTKPRALIVGGGFGGIKAALEMTNEDHFAVTLLSDSWNFHYYPTLYHTATGGAEEQSSIPLTRIFEDRDITIAHGKAAKLDRKHKTITTEDGKKFHFDILVMALGAVPNYFGIKGMADYAYSINSPESAKKFKTHLHQQLNDERKPDLNYVIVGGGPTGVELAGALPGYLKEIMKTHGIKNRAVHVDLIEAAPTVVPRMPKAMSKAIERRLRKLGVKLYLGKVVQSASDDSLVVDGKPIQSHTVVWTAGTANNPFFLQNDFKLNERGKVAVDEYLQAEEDIFVIGDNADTQYSGMAQTALYDGAFVGKNLLRAAKGKLVKPYVPKRPIYVFPVGPYWAAVLWGKTQIYGKVGYVLRSLADLVGFSDYEPWWRAASQWTTEFMSEEDCPTCAKRLTDTV